MIKEWMRLSFFFNRNQNASANFVGMLSLFTCQLQHLKKKKNFFRCNDSKNVKWLNQQAK